MNLSNALYEFTNELVNASSSYLAETVVHLDIYEEYKGTSGKWIRFSGMRGGEPVLLGDEVQVQNGVFTVFFLVLPNKQRAIDRVEARELSSLMASEWVKAVYLDQSLNNRICGIGEVFQFDDWANIGAVKRPITLVQIKINPR